MKRHFDDVRIYEWPGTGATADLSLDPEKDSVFVVVAWHEGRPYGDAFMFELIQMEDRVVAHSDLRIGHLPMEDRGAFQRKVLGLLLDLGIDRRIVGQGEEDKDLMFSSTADQSWSAVPFFVPDELWDRRYQDIEQYVSSGPGIGSGREPFLDRVVELTILDRGSDGLSANWGGEEDRTDLRPSREGGDRGDDEGDRRPDLQTREAPS